MEMLRAEINQLKKETRTFSGMREEETKSPTKQTKKSSWHWLLDFDSNKTRFKNYISIEDHEIWVNEGVGQQFKNLQILVDLKIGKVLQLYTIVVAKIKFPE